MKDLKDYYQVRDKVCVAYCDLHGKNKEVKPGVIISVQNDIVEIAILNCSGVVSTIKEKMDSDRIISLALAHDKLDRIAEKIETKIKKNKKVKK